VLAVDIKELWEQVLPLTVEHLLVLEILAVLVRIVVGVLEKVVVGQPIGHLVGVAIEAVREEFLVVVEEAGHLPIVKQLAMEAMQVGVK